MSVSLLHEPQQQQQQQQVRGHSNISISISGNDMAASLIGRAEEYQTLLQVYERSCTGSDKPSDALTTRPASSRPQELVFIQGPAGTGKTTLAKSIIDQVTKNQNRGFFLSGKFELGSSQKPYEAQYQPFDPVFFSCEHQQRTPEVSK
jgi:Tfp pilus assembly pilus retraction ATPase PilT